MKTANLKFLYVDASLCRAYYRSAHRLYCFQEDREGEFGLYVCTPDGEPSHLSRADKASWVLDTLPLKDEPIVQRFNEWFDTTPMTALARPEVLKPVSEQVYEQVDEDDEAE